MATSKKRIVHSDPEIMGGEIVFVGTRVPLKTLFDYIEGNYSLDEFLDDFLSGKRPKHSPPSSSRMKL